MQTGVSVAGVPTQVNLVASKRAPVAPMIGPSGVDAGMIAIAVPSLGATL